MAILKNVRVSDRSDFAEARRNDFISRKPSLSARQIYVICLALLLIVVGVGILLYNDTLVGSGLCVAVGTVLWFFARTIEQGQKKLQATQFLNAMFASLLAVGSRFTIAVKTDGEIVYLDHGFQDMFPAMMQKPHRTLDMLFDSYQVSADHRKSLMDTIAAGKEAKIPFAIADGNHTAHSLTLWCDPVPRPAGFFLLRGR